MTTPKAKPLPEPVLHCPQCRSKWEPARCDALQTDGSFKPGDYIRCVDCKMDFYRPLLLTTSLHAIQSAAQRLKVRPDDLAEALADGGIAEMVEALRDTQKIAADEAENRGSEPYAQEAIEACSKAQSILAKLPAAGKAGG